MDPRRLEEFALGEQELPLDLREEYSTEYQRSLLHEYLDELEERRVEALQLYEPSKFQEKFHSCLAKECLIQAGNRVGKSLAAFVEDARAATQQDPYKKFPETGTLVCVGYKEDHIGLVIYRYLFQPGAFKIIQDLETLLWRTFKPWLPEDWERRSEVKPAPPLIPKRFIADIAWEKRNLNIFKKVVLTTGWEILAFSSKGEPAQGFDSGLLHIDEDLEQHRWYSELVARGIMENCFIRWSALPHSKNDALLKLVERAEDEERKENPQTVVIRATVFDNPYMPAQARDEAIRIWKSEGEDEYRKRALGELTSDSRMVYPEFSKEAHSAMKSPPIPGEPDLRLEVQKILWDRNGEPPPDWMRVMIVDPGHQVCGISFLAVPPPKLGDYVVMYDELYIQKCDAPSFGRHVAAKASDQTFQRFIIDMQGGRLVGTAGGVPPYIQYSDALRDNGVKCVETGYAFRAGSTHTEGRRLQLHTWLHLGRSAGPKLLIVKERCENVVREFLRYRKKFVSGVIVDEPNDRDPHHLIDTLEYAAADGLEYHNPIPEPKVFSFVDQVLAQRKQWEEARKAKARAFGQHHHVTLGPTGS